MYFITCMERKPTYADDGGDFRTFGYYPTLWEAERALQENRLDLHEYRYMYAVIEHIEPGIHPNAQALAWYKYDSPLRVFVRTTIEELPFTNFALG